MAGYSVVDRRVSPPRVELPREYNAAVDFIDRHLDEGRGDKIAFRDDAGTLTYAALADRVARAAGALTALGVGMEQRVLLLLQDSITFPIAFFGAVRLGAVAVPVNTLLTAPDFDYVLRDSRAPVLIVSDALESRIAPVLAGQPFLRHLVRESELVRALDSATPLGTAAPTTRDDACFWLYTSGSTGQPKAAVHRQSHLAYTAEYYAIPILGMREDDLVFSAAKLFFAYGLGNAMTFPLRVGATALLMAERPTPAAVIRRLVEGGPTVFGGVPTLYASLLADPNLPRAGAHRLRTCISAGEALPADVSRRFHAHTGVDILDGIGSTEMLHIFISNRPGKVKHGTTGTVVPGYEARLTDESGQPVAPGQMGDLWVSGPSSASEYWNKRELSLSTFNGRWTRTGDRYLVDEEGCFIYQGRSDDMLKVSGQYVSPFEVEAALISHQAVLECAVVGHPDEHGLTKPKAFVVLRNAAHASADLAAALQAHVKQTLAPHKYPRWIEFIAELPKTATGKIQRFKLRQR